MRTYAFTAWSGAKTTVTERTAAHAARAAFGPHTTVSVRDSAYGTVYDSAGEPLGWWKRADS